jgi:ATP-dependent DNA helicase PIF1
LLEPIESTPLEEEFEHEPEPDEAVDDPIALLAGETAFRNPAEQDEDPDALGKRIHDQRYYWPCHVNTYRGVGCEAGMPDLHAGIHWWQRARELFPSSNVVDWMSQSTVDSLAPEQRLIYDKVITHYRNGEPRPLLLNIDGRAGTGKSFIINVLSARLAYYSGQHDTIQRCAPTGAASFCISGSTVHSLLRLPINKPIERLGAGPVQSL